MTAQISVAGIPVPFRSPVIIGLVGLHILFGLACVFAGAGAMLSPKQPGRHPTFGTIYYWCLAVVFASATILAAIRWREDYDLFLLGALAFVAATLGREARRRNWLPTHLSAMGASYILMLTAFYVDNGKNLPIWKDLPHITYWFIPGAIGVPIIAWALKRHPAATASH